MVSPIKDVAWMEWITRLMGEPQIRRTPDGSLPSPSFYCLLDEQPTHLTPLRLFRNEISCSATELIVNPCSYFSRNGGFPSKLPDGCGNDFGNFALQHPIVWIEDLKTRSFVPFWLGERLSAWMALSNPGDPEPFGLPEWSRAALTAAGVLVQRDWATRARPNWANALSHCQQAFLRGYVPIGGLIHPFHLAALRRYYRQLIRRGKAAWDNDSPLRYGLHNDPVARFFHRQLAPVVADIVGEAVKPSYVYVASYQGGAALRKHADREQCEFSITVCLDYSPEPRAQTPWPLYLETSSGLVKVYQALGDSLLYRGREIPHYRHCLPEMSTSTSIFFHYVREDFGGSLD
jgi:hypothetical protein